MLVSTTLLTVDRLEDWDVLIVSGPFLVGGFQVVLPEERCRRLQSRREIATMNVGRGDEVHRVPRGLPGEAITTVPSLVDD